METTAQIGLDQESNELIVIGHAMAVTREAGAVFTSESGQPDWGIDATIELKNAEGEATGDRVYLQLNWRDVYRHERANDGTEIFTINDGRLAEYWACLPDPVMLVARKSDGQIEWMDVREQCRRQGRDVRRLVFNGKSLTASTVALLRSNLNGGREPLKLLFAKRQHYVAAMDAIGTDAAVLAELQKRLKECQELIDTLSREPVIPEVTTKLRVLHLSDLHFTADTSPEQHLVPLLEDIRADDGLGLDTLDYLIVSGDMTDKGRHGGFAPAREFIRGLCKEFGLQREHCIFVPGNHDVQDLDESYSVRMSVDGLNDDQYVKEGRVYLVRDDTVYPNRLKKFSEKFFTPLTGRAYPLEPGDQGLSYFFPDTGIQFLTLNSAWQIDHLHRNRASAHPTAVSRAMYAARQQLSEAIDGKELKAEDNVLKLAVWHHAVAAHEMMRNVNFLTNLKKHGVQLCLHGDVHEMRSDLLGYKSGNEISVVGAGSFGSPPEGRPESTPRLYNLLEIQRDHSTVRVNTRARPNANGAWQGWYEWPDPEGKGRLPYFDIDL